MYDLEASENTVVPKEVIESIIAEFCKSTQGRTLLATKFPHIFLNVSQSDIVLNSSLHESHPSIAKIRRFFSYG